MPRCTVCAHPEHEAINAALVSGEAPRAVASRFVTVEGKPLGRMAVQRHKDEHLPAALSKAQDAKEVAHGDDLLKDVRELHLAARSILAKAYKANESDTALKAIREARGCVELLAKLIGQLDERPQINIALSGEWLQVRAVIINALVSHPEARQSVAKALMELEG